MKRDLMPSPGVNAIAPYEPPALGVLLRVGVRTNSMIALD